MFCHLFTDPSVVRKYGNVLGSRLQTVLYFVLFRWSRFICLCLFQVKAYGAGLEKTGCVINKPAEFTVSAKDAGKGPLKIVAQVVFTSPRLNRPTRHFVSIQSAYRHFFSIQSAYRHFGC